MKTMNLIDIGRVVRQRRLQLGLSQARLARLAGLSRQTLVGLERGSLDELGMGRIGRLLAVLGLQTTVSVPAVRAGQRGLLMAARNSSVSYGQELSAQDLADVLSTAQVPAPYRPHIMHLLDETPVPVVVMAVDEAAAQSRQPVRKIWANVATLAHELSVHRRQLWA